MADEREAGEQHVAGRDRAEEHRADDLAAERAEHGADAGERRERAARGERHAVGQDRAERALREVVGDLHDGPGDGDLHEVFARAMPMRARPPMSTPATIHGARRPNRERVRSETCRRAAARSSPRTRRSSR